MGIIDLQFHGISINSNRKCLKKHVLIVYMKN